ncbi:Alpha/beta hydrolase family protein [Amycolatopsis xylanica]|uniref:Alpha/beta hydrolase family protein n=1 Tax=Amycolatopsis xylanica TaxID=589385 RepID=A0A1H2ZR36_9PSEU|nr:alpha/beta fold hydrolase [Amycolatopsis xylanica]SDX19328.1 Alpha/beta hydrolase family protein [Amycolatopsis xylanica]
MIEHTRRAALLTGALSLAAAGTAQATPDRRVPTFVFAAGANGSAGIPNELVLRGHRCVGVDLPGQRTTDAQFRLSYQAPQDLAAFAAERSPLAGVTYADQIRATVEVVRRAARFGPVVLVGASIGGATISLIANEVPHLIDLLVYDTAFCCVDLATPDEYMATPEAATTEALALLGIAVGDPAMIGASRSNWRTADPKQLADLKSALMADGTDAEFFAFLNSVAPDELLTKGATDARGRLSTWGRVPRVYIRHLKDRLVPLPLQDRMIREADKATPRNRFRVFDLDTGHVSNAASQARYLDILDGLGRKTP